MPRFKLLVLLAAAMLAAAVVSARGDIHSCSNGSVQVRNKIRDRERMDTVVDRCEKQQENGGAYVLSPSVSVSLSIAAHSLHNAFSRCRKNQRFRIQI